jgi:hypothetical protein
MSFPEIRPEAHDRGQSCGLPSVRWRLNEANQQAAVPLPAPSTTLEQIARRITSLRKALAIHEKTVAENSCVLACHCYQTDMLLQHIRRLEMQQKKDSSKALKRLIARLEITADAELRFAELLEEKVLALQEKARGATEALQDKLDKLEKYAAGVRDG